MSILIAIPEMGNSLFRKYMKSKYVNSLHRAGAECKWIDLSSPSFAAKQACACDGLLLPGGADINPELYHQKRSEKCGEPNKIRDAAEPVILKAFLQTGKPIFAICRGIQVINVTLGGTLFQDIKGTQQLKHSNFLKRGKTVHNLSIQKSSKLYDIIQKETIAVNSIHHQAIDQLGNGVVAISKSEDGFIEAIELKDYGFCLGVQWHPEHMSKHFYEQAALLKEFVTECKKGQTQ